MSFTVSNTSGPGAGVSKTDFAALLARVANIEAASDVVDIVATKAALDAYDKSALTDNDIIKVLADETNGGNEAYWRYLKATDAFSFIGSGSNYLLRTGGDVTGTVRFIDPEAGTGTLNGGGFTFEDFFGFKTKFCSTGMVMGGGASFISQPVARFSDPGTGSAVEVEAIGRVRATKRVKIDGSNRTVGTTMDGDGFLITSPKDGKPALNLRDGVAQANAETTAALKSLIGAGIAAGLATLDDSAKVPMSQLPDAILGALVYQTTWNAKTNTPAIPAASSANKGWYYMVSVAGTTQLDIPGPKDWDVGDWVVSNGTHWDKVDNTDAVLSVAGIRGAVSAAALRSALGMDSALGKAMLNAYELDPDKWNGIESFPYNPGVSGGFWYEIPVEEIPELSANQGARTVIVSCPNDGVTPFRSAEFYPQGWANSISYLDEQTMPVVVLFCRNKPTEKFWVNMSTFRADMGLTWGPGSMQCDVKVIPA